MLATNYLLGLGHRRIGFIGGRPDLESARLREAGFRKAMADAGVSVDDALVRVGGYRIETAVGPARELLSRADRPTAVFAANDLSAIATMTAARGLGLTVPDDLSVIGFDNVPESALASPPLTTIKQPLQQMGAEALTPAGRPHRRRRTRHARAAAHRTGGARLLHAAALRPASADLPAPARRLVRAGAIDALGCRRYPPEIFRNFVRNVSEDRARSAPKQPFTSTEEVPT